MIKKTSTLLLSIALYTSVLAQEDSLMISPTEEHVFTQDILELPEPKVTFDFEVRAAFTSGEFKDFYPKDGMGGLGITVLIPLGKKNPLDVGIGMGYYFMSETRSSFAYYTPGVGDYDVDARVSGSMIPFHAVARIYPLKGTNSIIQPYFEGLAGFRLFKSTQRLETYIHNSGVTLEPEINSEVTSSWSYGFGGGLKVKVSKNNLLYLNAKVTQLYGTPTDYMDPTTVTIYDDGSYEYFNQRSRTDVLQFSFGLHLMIE